MESTQKIGSRDARLKSRGCLSCIRMKVKCDEAKPHCQRCQKSRRVCPGYRDQNALVFRAETGLPSGESLSKTVTVYTSSSSVPIPMPTDWVQCAVSYYFHNYVLTRKDGFPGHYDFLPRLYGSNAEAGYFRNSVEAVALASFAQAKKMSPIYFRRSRQSYGLALMQLGFVLNNATEAYSPASLAAVALLWMYDVITGEDKLEFRSPHRQGLLEIFRTRLSLNANGEKWINRPILATIHMQNIDGPPSSAGATPAVAPSPPFPRGVSLLEELLPRVAKVSITNDTLIQRMPNRVEATESLRRLQHLFEDLDTWEGSLPKEWLYKTYPNPKSTDRSPFPLAVVVFPTLSVGGMWTAKWLAQLSVLRSMVLLAPIVLQIDVPCPPPAEIRKQIRSVAALLCSSIPYLLGHVTEEGNAKAIEDTPAFGAFFATRSLFVIAQLPWLSEEQVNWILDRLGEIGQEKGIRRALILRESIARRRVANLRQAL